MERFESLRGSLSTANPAVNPFSQQAAAPELPKDLAVLKNFEPRKCHLSKGAQTEPKQSSKFNMQKEKNIAKCIKMLHFLKFSISIQLHKVFKSHHISLLAFPGSVVNLPWRVSSPAPLFGQALEHTQHHQSTMGQWTLWAFHWGQLGGKT